MITATCRESFGHHWDETFYSYGWAPELHRGVLDCLWERISGPVSSPPGWEQVDVEHELLQVPCESSGVGIPVSSMSLRHSSGEAREARQGEGRGKRIGRAEKPPSKARTDTGEVGAARHDRRVVPRLACPRVRERSGRVQPVDGNSNGRDGDDGADRRPIEREGSLPARETQRGVSRRGRSAHQAVEKAREHYKAGYHRVVSLDLEEFFDRVNQDKMMSAVRDRVKDRRVRRLIRRYLQTGMLAGDVYIPRSEGTPQGGPLSPLLANLLLDQLDRELERRGHRFVRYADDVSIYVKSERAGRRVLQSLSDYLSRKLKLSVNKSKSRVDKPRHCSLLGFRIGKAGRVFVSDKSIRRLKDRIRELRGRHRGRRVEQIVRAVADYLRGWQQYFNYAYNKQKFRELTAWIKRRLRASLWTQWGRAGYRELRKRGVSRDLAWNTCQSHHGPWRLSRSPAPAFALPTGYFVELGLPLLHVNV